MLDPNLAFKDSRRLEYFLTADEIRAAETLRSTLGVDVTSTYQFWENAVSRMLDDAELTSMACPWDLEIPYGSRKIRVEVKASNAFKGTWVDGSRWVFRWADRRGIGNGGAHVVVLIGVHGENVYSWVAPSTSFWKCSGVTSVVPDERAATARRVSRLLQGRQVPCDQILAATLRAHREYHNAPRQAKAAMPQIEPMFVVT